MVLPQQLEAVFLDIGGPIYDDENFVGAVVHALDDLLARQSAGPVDRAAVRAIYQRIRVEQRGSFRTALATEILGDATLRDELQRRTEQYWRHPAGTMYPEVPAFLAGLHGALTVGVLANQPAGVADDLRRDGVAELIDVWGISAIVGHEKPSRELFDWALDQAGTTADRAVHVGNRLDNDVRPAAALGLGTVWVLRGDAPPEPTNSQLAEPDLVVDDLTGLADMLLVRAGCR